MRRELEPRWHRQKGDAVLSRRHCLDPASAIPEVGGRPSWPWSTAASGALILGRWHTTARQPRRLQRS